MRAHPRISTVIGRQIFPLNARCNLFEFQLRFTTLPPILVEGWQSSLESDARLRFGNCELMGHERRGKMFRGCKGCLENVGKIDYDLNQNRELMNVFIKIGGLIRFFKFKFNCELVYTCSNLMRIINYHEK